MFNLLKVFFTGMAISFLGSLPLGSLNIAAMQVAIRENVRRAVFFSLGVALVEIAYVRLSLTGMDWVMGHRQLFRALEWATVFLFLLLGASSLITARKKQGEQKNILLNNQVNRFWLGVMMSAINPVQIPFWFIWSTYLLSTKILLPTTTDYTTYTIGIGIGTLSGLALFIFGGRWLVQKINASHRAINLVVALVFFISAVIQLYRVWNKPFGASLGQ
jgi:threonine/homoserine/homoserine lactone efflux protein